MLESERIGLIPAAGRGLRLGLPYPKELYPIIRKNRYKPVSQYVLENLLAAGIKHVVFVINETKHQLMAYFGDGNRFGCNISYVIQENRDNNEASTSPGLAHALDSTYHLIVGKTVFFGMPDTIMTPVEVFSIVHNAMHKEDEVGLGLFQTDRPDKGGMVRFDDKGRVLEIVDKPKKTDLNHTWGIIIWRPSFTEYLHKCLHQRRINDFAIVMNMAIKDSMSFRAKVTNGEYRDLGTYEEIMELESRFKAD